MPDPIPRALPRWVPLTALAALFVIWSNSFHAIAFFRRDLGLSAADLVTLRFGPLVPIGLAWCLARRAVLFPFLARAWPRVVLLGLLLVPGYNLPLNFSQLRVPPATASLITVTNPVFTLLLALLFLHERTRPARLAGLALAFVGVFLLVDAEEALHGADYWTYALVGLTAPLVWAVSTVMTKPLTARIEPFLLTAACLTAGSLPFFAALVLGLGQAQATLAAMPPLGWAAFLHLSLLCTLLGFGVWNWALRHLQASTVAAFVFLNPPLTSLFGMLWGTEEPTWETLLYGSIILAGVALSTRPARRAA